MSAVAAAPVSPYKGLAAFEDSELDALFFFGRDRDSQVIAANLMASRLTVLFGPTGVGKTSVLRAGVAYRLRQEAGVDVRVHSSWTGDPQEALEGVTSRTSDDLYLILDQFEEYFLYHEHDRRFIEELAEVVRRPDLRVNVLIGIREDALAQLDLFKADIPNLLSNRLRLDRLDRAAGEDAILGPVGRYNALVPAQRRVEIEPALVSTVLDEVAAGRVELGAVGRGVVTGAGEADRIEAPYLQLVMTRLWEVEEESDSKTLRLATLRELGGAAQIVPDHLEHAMAELSPRQKDAVAEMYNFLVTPSGTKIAHGVRDLAGYADIEEDEAADVLRRLAAERIVRASSDDGAATRYEIYHDVLADAVAAWRNRYRAERAVHEAERRRRRAFAVATASLVGLVLVAAIAIFALVERGHSRSQARRAHARELAAAATSHLGTEPQTSIRLALQAAKLERGPAEENVLRDALRLDAQRAVLLANGPVRIARFDATGQHIVTGSKDGRIRIYRAGSGVPEHVLNQGGPVTAADYRLDGLLLTAGRDGSARLWDSGGALVRRLNAGGPVRSASFGNRGRLVLTVAYNGVIRVWRTWNGRLLRTIRVERDALPRYGVIDPNGRMIVTVGNDRFARVYAIATGRHIRSLKQEGRIHCAAFTPAGERLITCGHEGVVRVWAHAQRLVRELRGPRRGQAILDGVFSPNGSFVAAAVADGSARVWNATSGQLVGIMFGHANAVTKVAFSPNGRGVVTAGADNRARTWEPDGGPVWLLAGHTGAINSVEFSPDGRFVVTASDDRTARVWDSGTEPDLRLVVEQPSVTAFAVAPDGKRVIVGDEKGIARVRAVGRKRVLSIRRTRGPVTAVAFGPAGPLVASMPSTSVAVSADGKWLASGRADGSVVFHEAGHRQRVVSASQASVSAVAFSSDGEILATGDERGDVLLWSTRSGKRLRSLAGHKLRITSLAFSPDGRLLLSASTDHEARTWDVKSGHPRHVLGLHYGPVVGASFSRDGRWIVTAGCCGASVIRASTGRRVLILRGHTRPLIGAGFAGDDGRLIVTASKDGTIREYHCDICGDVNELIALAERRLRSS